MVREAIKQAAQNIEIGAQKRGLVPRHDLQSYVAFMLFWLIGTVLSTLSDILFWRVLPKLAVVGFNLPFLLLILISLPPFSWIV